MSWLTILLVVAGFQAPQGGPIDAECKGWDLRADGVVVCSDGRMYEPGFYRMGDKVLSVINPDLDERGE